MDPMYKIGEALIGDGPELAHIDLLIGDKFGPVGQAFANGLSNTNIKFYIELKTSSIKTDNSKYKSTTSMINVNGVIHSGKDWSRALGIGLNTINKYVRKYGLNNTIIFIEKYLENPGLELAPRQSYYDLYMN